MTYEELGRAFATFTQSILDEVFGDTLPEDQALRDERIKFVEGMIACGVDPTEAADCFDTILGLWKRKKGF